MSDERPLVSICIPAFNAERWIGAALESAVRQTYTELELVLADNGSTDATVEIAREAGDPRLRIETSTASSRSTAIMSNPERPRTRVAAETGSIECGSSRGC